MKQNYSDKLIAGGKGASLQRLLDSHFPVPEFEIITSEEFHYWEETKKLSPKTIAKIVTFTTKNQCNYFAIRSSATAEDGAENSYAGVLETFLYTKKQDIEEKVIKCFESFYSERILEYERLRENHSKESDNKRERGSMAVVIQRMLDSTVSGVAFSRSPDLDNGLIYIESGLGLGEGVVSGLVDVDRFYIDRFGERIKEDIAEKTDKLTYVESTNKVERIVFEAPIKDPSLDEKKIEELLSKILKIEENYGFPCDIEWSFVGEQLYILQVRPITQKFNNIELYIDTNLSESYPGHTTPITGDYVNLAYAKVHYELADYIGFDKRKKDSLLPYLNTMTNYIHGHMYYRLESYYNILLSIPGGEQNLKNWHRMIGGKTNSSAIKTTVDAPDVKDQIIFYKFLFKIVTKHHSIFKSFLSNARKKKDELYQRLETAKTTAQKINSISFAINTTKGFSLTAFNDVLTMKGLNTICKILNKYSISEDIIPFLIKTDEGVDSLAPLNAINELAKDFENEAITQVYKEAMIESQSESIFKRYRPIYRALEEKGFKSSAVSINKFLSEYGDRSFEELKLESLSLKHSPELLLKIIKLHTSHSVNPTKSTQTDKELKKLNFLDRYILKYAIKKTKSYIATREACRLVRGEFYGWYRECLLSIFEDLKATPELSEYHINDFFYLHLNDLFLYARGERTNSELAKIIAGNLLKYRSQSEYPELVYLERGNHDPYFIKTNIQHKISNKNMIQGLSASKGNITGKVLLIASPSEALDRDDLHECILVTQNTDPAWIYIMTKCKGLISEKGSLLSHTAIIGRELGVPTIVGAKKVTKYLRGVDKINLNADNGTITIQ